MVTLTLGVSHALANQNVVILLDDSGSMSQAMRSAGRTRKIDAAKTALKTVLEQLPDDAQVGLVVLNGGRQPWLIPFGKVDRRNLDQILHRINARGGTPLGQFMKVAADALLQALQQSRAGALGVAQQIA